MPQNAALSVMPLLQILIKPTGPQDDAKTVAMKVVSQKISGGNTNAASKASVPTTSMLRRLNLSVFDSSPVL